MHWNNVSGFFCLYLTAKNSLNLIELYLSMLNIQNQMFNVKKNFVFFTAVWSKRWTNACVKCLCDCSALAGFTCNLRVIVVGQGAQFIRAENFEAIHRRHFSGAICDVMLKPPAHSGTRAQSRPYCATEAAAACSSSGSTACLGKRRPLFVILISNRVAQCGIVLALRARRALVMPPQRHINCSSAT